MTMNPARYTIILLFCLNMACTAQVLSVSEIKDTHGQAMQQRYIAQLRVLSSEAAAIHFPYPFYFSQTLDIDEAQQQKLPQRSIHFDHYHGQVVLEITGNYYASYSTGSLNANQRARLTFQDVVMSLLKAAVAHVDRSVPIDAYAFEVAHHVRTKVLKVDTEGPENLTMILPRAVAERLVAAKDAEARQDALLESEVFLNGERLTLWLTGDEAPVDVKDRYLARYAAEPSRRPSTGQAVSADAAGSGTLVNPDLIPQSELLTRVRQYDKTPHDVSPAMLEKLQSKYQDTLTHLIPDLKAPAHFVEYAPPSFIAFHDGAYLQLNMTTELEQPAGASQYRIAALAFETHISHLLRPVSKYFHDSPQFDGIDFSTTVHQSVQPNTQSVEFVTPLAALLCYEKYDCTGQELVNRSIVLINGERVSLDLQKAESEAGKL